MSDPDPDLEPESFSVVLTEVAIIACWSFMLVSVLVAVLAGGVLPIVLALVFASCGVGLTRTLTP